VRPNNKRAHLLDITCYIYQGALHFSVRYHRNIYSDDKIKYFIHLLRKRLHAVDRLTFGSSAKLPLSFMQEGLLFHSMEKPKSNIYWVRVKWETYEALNLACYKRAFELLLEYYPQLNVLIQQKDTGEFIQSFNSTVTLPWRFIDVSDDPKRRDALLKQEKPIIRKLSQSPLLTVTVIGCSPHHYVTCFDHHHALLDGWSLGILLNTLQNIYRRLCLKSNPPTVSKQDTAGYLRWVSQSVAPQVKKYWQQYLQEASPFLSLGIEKQASRTRASVRHRRKTYALSRQETNTIDQIAKKYGITPNVIFQTAWAVLLSLYANQEDVVLGMTFSLRGDQSFHFDHEVGLCINTLPFRVKLPANMRIDAIWYEVQQRIQRIIQNGRLSLIELHRWFQPNLSQGGFFNFLYVFENFPFKTSDFFKDISVYDTTHYSLSISIEARGLYKIILNYDVNLYTNFDMGNTLKYYLNVIKKCINSPKRLIKEVDVLTEKEKLLLLNKLNLNLIASDYSNVVKTFENQAVKNKHNIAVSYQGSHITYGELNKRSNQLSHYLLRRKNLLKKRIAIFMPRSDKFVLAILSILKLSACYIPLDQNWPVERINLILQDSKPSALLSLSHFLPKKIDKNIEVICIDKIYNELVNMPQHNLNVLIQPDDIAYVIYTSGTTGNPKGVLIPHKNIMRLFHRTQKWFRFNQTDVWTLFHSFAFDFSVWEMWGALIYGGELVVIPYEMTRSLNEFYKLVISKKITVLNITPTAFSILSNYDQTIQKYNHISLRYIIFGGEALNFITLKSWIKKYGVKKPKLINMYGITETTIHTTYYRIKKSDVEKLPTSKCSIIGKPLDDMKIFLLDENLNFVPQSSVGMIYVGGAGVADGYLNHLKLTKERFIKNPYRVKNVPILYKSGDLARLLPNGLIEYCQRADNQIKLRGFRVELGEIRSQILRLHDIKDAFIHSIEEGLNKKIIAFLLMDNMKSFKEDEIIKWLKRFLPTYMVPSILFKVTKIPMTNSGKVDIKKLTALYEKSLKTTKRKSTIHDFPELHMLKSYWAEILQRNDISLHDNLFLIGGHSLLVLKLIQFIHVTFGIQLDIRDIYSYPSLQGMLHLILEKKKKLLNTSPNKLNLKSPAILLRKSKNKRFIFLIHPVGGTIFWFSLLSPYISTSINIYGIQDPCIENSQLLFSSIKGLATFYMKSIKKIQPEGPYILGGASFGANVSIEVAKQLSMQGNSIKKLLLLDGWAKFPKLLSKRNFLEKNMWRQYNYMMKLLQNKQFNALKPIIDLSWYRAKQLDAYKMECFDFNTTLFKSQITVPVLRVVESSTNHWDNYASNLKVVIVPGDHETMFYPPNVKHLGECISNEL
jgi:amino acid adenylation domain-containing protein